MTGVQTCALPICYFSTFDVPVAYPFGYGLSYTTFDYSNLKPGGDHFDGNGYTVTVDVTNSGDVPGKEVVQLYLHAPDQTLSKPEEELRAFAKTALLKPGESETVSLTLIPEDLASFDESRSAWVAEPGTYEVRIGASSKDIKGSVSFDLKDEIVVCEVSNALAPQRNFKRLQK